MKNEYEFHKIFNALAKRKRIHQKNKKEIETLFNIDRKFSKLFAIKKENKIISFAQVFCFKDEILLNSLANTGEAYKLNVNSLLIWSIIEWGQKSGFDYFDLGGYETNARKNSIKYKINKFKLSFGEKKDFYLYTNSKSYLLLRRIYSKLSL